MRQIIHIGYPKTGTTWFQKEFYPNITNFKYLDREFFRSKILYNSNKLTTDDKNILSSNLIICEEEIVNIKQGYPLPIEKAKRIKEIFPKAIIIIFFRNQLDLLLSKYSEYIKSGGTYKISDYFEHVISKERLEQWDYLQILKQYQNLFGKESVHYFLYEDFKSKPSIFIEKYIKQFQFEIPIDSIKLDKKNIRYAYPVIKLARFTNKMTKRQFYVKYTYKTNFIHIPFVLPVTHGFYKILNTFYTNNKTNISNFIDEDLFNFIVNYFIKVNKELYNELNLEDLKKYKYPL